MIYIMVMANLGAVDLNLLVALDALLAERHVTRAGQRVGLSQSGMSNALGRLRELFDDPLLVRRGAQMRLTPRAQELREPLRDALSLVEHSVLTRTAFDPAKSPRCFVLSGDDYAASALLVPWLRRARACAPEVRTRLVPHNQALPVEALSDGHVDVAVGSFWSVPAGLQRDVLWQEGFACVLPRALLGPRTKLTLDRFLSLPHVLVSPSGAERGTLDELLASRGLERRVVATLPSFHALPELLQTLGAIATVPSRIVDRLEGPLQRRPPPLRTPSWPVSMVWDRRLDADPAHRWLRDELRTAVD